MLFDKLEYKGIFAEYIVKYLEEQKSIGHNMFYVKYILRDFDRYLVDSSIDKYDKFNKKIIEGWLIKKDTESYSTRKNRAVIIKLFLIYLSNYFDNVFVIDSKKYYGGEKFIPYIFTNDEIKQIFGEIHRYMINSLSKEIFKIVTNILYCCGTRVTETLLIKIEDINFSEKYIIIKNSKGSKERIVPINDLIVNLLKDFINNYCKTYNSDDYIFENLKTHKPITRVTILNYFHHICSKCNIYTNTKNYPRIHDLRHTYIVHCMTKLEQEYKDINSYIPILSTMVGHEEVKNTMYYSRFTPERIKVINTIENNSSVIIPKLGEENE